MTDSLKLAAQKALEACPFCGNAPRYLAANPGFYTERVICDHCGFHLKPEQWRERAAKAKAKAKASDTSYVCPQCGPDPRGPDVHARERHEWPLRSALQHQEGREPGRSIARITGLCFVGAEGEPACIAGVEGCKVAHTVVKYATPPLLQKEEGDGPCWLVEKRKDGRTVGYLGHACGSYEWMPTPDKATRFVRREDANGVAECIETEDVIIAEHIWG